MSALIAMRDVRESDKSFVLHSWRESLKLHWLRNMLQQIGFLSRDSKTSIRIACDASSPDDICGYAVYSGDCLHFVYVKQTVRKLGVARTLLKDLPIKTYSLTTPAFETRCKPTARGWEYTPYAEVKGAA